MRTVIEGNQLIAYPEGRISSANAPDMQQALEAAMAGNPGLELVIDAGALDYISSAGLRVLLKLTRDRHAPLEVRNVSLEIYETMQITGFASILNVKKRMRRFDVEGCEIVGRGAIGTVYRVDEDTIVKVYEIPDSLPMIENEQKRAKQAFLKGIPTAISYDIVKVGDKYGSVFEMLKASTFMDLILDHPERTDEIVGRYARFIRDMHAVQMEPGELPEAREVFLGCLDALKHILPEAVEARLRALLEAMPENLHVVHGDIQMKNVMLSGDQPLLIDMDTLSVGDPVFDLMGLYVTNVLYNEDEPDNTLGFLGLPADRSAAIYEKVIRCYFEGLDADALREVERRLMVVARLRFLYLVGVLGISLPELKAIRIEHSVEQLKALLDEVDALTVGQYLY